MRQKRFRLFPKAFLFHTSPTAPVPLSLVTFRTAICRKKSKSTERFATLIYIFLNYTDEFIELTLTHRNLKP